MARHGGGHQESHHAGATFIMLVSKWSSRSRNILRHVFASQYTTRLVQVLEDEASRNKLKAALREAAINSALDHPNIVSTFSYNIQPLCGPQVTFLPSCPVPPYPSLRDLVALSNGRLASTTNSISLLLQPQHSSGEGISDWQMYLIQEYCDGGNLFRAISTGVFHRPDFESRGRVVDFEGILSIVTDIAAGCLYIHNKHIIHGDLKPDNVSAGRGDLYRVRALFVSFSAPPCLTYRCSSNVSLPKKQGALGQRGSLM